MQTAKTATCKKILQVYFMFIDLKYIKDQYQQDINTPVNHTFS